MKKMAVGRGRSVSLLVMLLLFAGVASADTIYNVSGTFEPTSSSNPFTGPLNGGSFSGTFSATLPIASGGETITTFDINLMNSSGTILATLSNSTAGDSAFTEFLPSGCAIGPSTLGACDIFRFSNLIGSDVLQLITPTEFAGGAIYPYYTTASLSTFAELSGSDSLVASGSIEPAAEPGTLSLVSLALVAGLLWLERKRLLA